MLDSVSRQNSIRHLPRTRQFLLEELNAVEFLMHNKVGLNTRPNMAALFTGDVDGLDLDEIGPSIWNEFQAKGFWTFFADDWDTEAGSMKMRNVEFDRRLLDGQWTN